MSDEQTPADPSVQIEWADQVVGITCPCGHPDEIVLEADRFTVDSCPGCGAQYSSEPVYAVRISRNGEYVGEFS